MSTSHSLSHHLYPRRRRRPHATSVQFSLTPHNGRLLGHSSAHRYAADITAHYRRRGEPPILFMANLAVDEPPGNISLPTSLRFVSQSSQPRLSKLTTATSNNDQTLRAFIVFRSRSSQQSTRPMPGRRRAGHRRTSGGTVPHPEGGRPLRGPSPLTMGYGGALPAERVPGARRDGE